MGYAFIIAPCYCCGQVFTFNPNKVTSVRINGIREPLCQGCVEKINVERKAKGLEQIVAHPEAYQPCSEYEL